MSDDKEPSKIPYRPIERYIQLIAGLLMWSWLMYADHTSGVEYAELNYAQIGILLGKYAFAAVLIKGWTGKEVAELLRAWRGK